MIGNRNKWEMYPKGALNYIIKWADTYTCNHQKELIKKNKGRRTLKHVIGAEVGVHKHNKFEKKGKKKERFSANQQS